MSHAATTTVAGASAKYRVKAQVVLHWIKNGELRAVNVARNPHGERPRWRIPLEALAEFEANRVACHPKSAPAPRRRRRDPNLIEFV